MGWMWFIWPLMILVIVLVVVLLVRGSGGGTNRGSASAPGPGTGRTRAQEILDERYARGELTDEEYQDRLRQLRGDTGR